METLLDRFIDEDIFYEYVYLSLFLDLQVSQNKSGNPLLDL